jgi:hypothetical protein
MARIANGPVPNEPVAVRLRLCGNVSHLLTTSSELAANAQRNPP